jgi:hypothetical protein
MRRASVNARALEGIAKQLGRREDNTRGKEPVWVNPSLGVFPLSIPRHGGRDLAVGTKNSILDQLEEDILAWEERLENE